MRENLDDELTEVKSENAIDRITSQANPRTLERVPAGARFHTRLRDGRAVRRGRPAVPAGAGRPAAAGRRRAGRRRLSRQRPGELLQPAAGVARTGNTTPPALRKRRSARARRWPPSRPPSRIRRSRFCTRSNESGTGRETPPRRALGASAPIRGRATAWTPSITATRCTRRCPSAMARLGSLEDWLEATARAAAPAVCFSSCFPFLEEIVCVVPPRTRLAARGAGRFRAGAVEKRAFRAARDRASRCWRGASSTESSGLWTGPASAWRPPGSPGPFRTSVRWSAAVDRLTGATERHSTACIEFRAGCGLWTVAVVPGRSRPRPLAGRR